MQNFNFMNLWAQGDAMLHAITVLLIAMSLATWIVIVSKVITLAQLRRTSTTIKNNYWRQVGLESVSPSSPSTDDTASDDKNPFTSLASTGQIALKKYNEKDSIADAKLSLSDWLIRSFGHAIDQAIENLQSGLSLLASIGATAPFVGLLGTVWGIYHALQVIGKSGNATLDVVAGPVGEALIMTALGLVVAIPAVLGHNALQRENKRVAGQLNRFAHDLHTYHLTGMKAG